MSQSTLEFSTPSHEMLSMDKLDIVFIGSGCLAIPALKLICGSGIDDIQTVVTQPDRPSGRSRVTAPCPLKPAAADLGLCVHTPESINSASSLGAIRINNPDLFVVAAYGQLLSKELLSIPKLGAINIHPSLLPRYRGAAPIQWALINGDGETGVTIQYVAEKMDAGDIIAQEREPIDPDDTAETLESRLAQKGAELLINVLDDFRIGNQAAAPQDDRLVSFAPKLKKADGWFQFKDPASSVANRVRGMYPWPCCFCDLKNGQKLRVISASSEPGKGTIGQVLNVDSRGPLIACGKDALRLLEVQPEGRKRMSGVDFCNGYNLSVGDLI